MQKLAASCALVRENPRFQLLLKRRNRYAYTLAGLIVLAYFSFILAVAFRPHWLAQTLQRGMTTNVGILFGLGVIALTILLTVLYVRRANREFDPEALEIRRQALK